MLDPKSVPIAMVIFQDFVIKMIKNIRLILGTILTIYLSTHPYLFDFPIESSFSQCGKSLIILQI